MKPSVSVCIITLGRETIYHALESVFSQKIDTPFEVVLILQGMIDVSQINSLNKNKVPYRIFTYDNGLGFGFYRNKAVEHAAGDIIAWMDDDEWAMDEYWLQKITQPIKNGRYQVVTSGYKIQLGQGYMTDCISLLGWPGGGALGFEKMWKIGFDQHTTHLCTGNFAINKALIEEIHFSTETNYGGEDNALAKDLLTRSVPIFYEKFATVYHVARSFSQALNWWKLRAKNYRKATNRFLYEESPTIKKLRFFKNLCTLDRYIFGRFICLACIGYFFIKARHER